MDVWEYFGQRERDFDDMSLDGRNVQFFAENDSRDQRGHMLGHVYFDGSAYLDIHERIEVKAGGNGIRRTDYAYFLIIDGLEVWGEERDPTHNPPVHRHIDGHEREDATPISFRAVCEKAWRSISLARDTP